MFISYLVSSITATQTTIEVPDGTIFPQTQVFEIWVDREKMACLSFASANVLNVERGHEGTIAAAHDADDLVALDVEDKQHVRTSKSLDAHDVATTGIHGVGTSIIASIADVYGLKLDDTAAPEDNTDNDATTAKHGLMPKADKVKLDGIEASADVTDATNVAAAGAVMEGDTTTVAMQFVVDEDDMVSNLNTKVPTQQSVKAYADQLIGTANAVTYKGVIDCSGNPNYPAANCGDLYVVSVTGKIGGVSGITVDVGDMCLCNTDSTASGDQATVGTKWNIIEKNIVGAVTGSGTSGKIAKWTGTSTVGDGTNTDTDVASTVSAKHTQGTDTALGAVGTKNPAIDADKVIYRDSTASDALVTSTWTQIKAFLKTYFDTLYNLYVHPNHSGEVTSVADGAQTIATAAVTLAKMANLAQDKIIGRATASTGVPEAIDCTAAGRALLDDATNTDQRTTLGLGTMAVATATDYVAKALLDADTVLTATSDNTPVATTMAEQTVLGRLTGGHPDDIAIGIADNNIVQIDQYLTAADNTYAKFTAYGLEGISYSGVVSDLGIEAGATKYPDTGEQAFLDADHSKLDAIEASADVTDATNVAAAGAVMEADTTTAAMSFVIDEDNMASNSATKIPTQQSVKAYADAVGAGAGLSIDYQGFASTGTWTKPASKTMCYVEVIGSGGGGAGGKGAAAGVSRQGGAGGGGSARFGYLFDISTLGATETVTVGLGGTSGAGGSSTTGSDGGDGGVTSFGSWISIAGGDGGLAFVNGGTGGIGTVRGDTDFNGGTGGASSTGAGLIGGSKLLGCGGGGAGGGLTTGNVETVGGAGGSAGSNAGGTAGAVNGGAGGAGNTGGSGGGGGGSQDSGTGGVGGLGGLPGGGGGGGAGGTTTGGAGGVGAKGYVKVWSW